MSNKKKALDWAAEILAESNMPSEDFQWSLGSNYGLDGYHFDQTMGEGVKERPGLPGASPGPAPGSGAHRGSYKRPQDMVASIMGASVEAPLDEAALMQDNEGGLHLGTMFTVEEGHDKNAAIMDLLWLDPTQGQDPNRLPDNPVDKGIAELEEAWGVNRRTDGVSRIPAKDLEAERYHQQMNNSPHPATPGPKQDSDEHLVRAAAMKAVRDAHFGKPLDEIKRDLVAALGDDASNTRGVVAHLSRDIGLAGNVFIRANAFPGIKNGKWVQEIKRRARGARYVITDDPSIGTKLGMQAVPAVPWEQALRHYGPLLKAAGYELDLSKGPQEALRGAFKKGPTAAYAFHVERPKPVEVRPADTVTLAEAVRQFQASTPEVMEEIRVNDGSQARRAKALAKVSQWLASGDLTSRQVYELRKLGTDDMLKRASEWVSAPKTGTYEGAGLAVKKGAELSRKEGSGTTKTAEFERLALWTRRAMNEGWMGKDLDQLIQARWNTDLLRKAAQDIRELRAQHEGLAGHVYVDAAAYASPTGYTGCKEAASKHRTNQVKRVLAMGRCGSCVHKKAMLDGSGHCSVYNKPLIEAAALEGVDLRALQEEAIKGANASDAEATASLFTNQHTSIVSEFGLVANMDVTLDNTPDIEKLGELLFDGILLNVGEGK